MGQPKPIRYLSVRGIPALKPVLERFLRPNEQVARTWAWSDFPWWYNERANLGMLAAAVWKSNGIAFEEFTSPKRHFRGTRRSTYTGRNDLYINLRGREFIVEAKNTFLSAFPRNARARDYVQDKLLQASRDVKKPRPYGCQRLAVLFISPRFEWSQRHEIDVLIRKWIEEIKTVRHTLSACVFPAASRTTAVWKKTSLFPGIAILVRKA